MYNFEGMHKGFFFVAVSFIQASLRVRIKRFATPGIVSSL